MGQMDVGRSESRGTWMTVLRGIAGWGVLGAVAARWAMRVTDPGTVPDTIRGRVLSLDGTVTTPLVGATVAITPTTNAVPTSDATDGSGYSFAVLGEDPPKVPPTTYTVTADVPAGHSEITGHPRSVNVHSYGQGMTFTVDFKFKKGQE